MKLNKIRDIEACHGNAEQVQQNSLQVLLYYALERDLAALFVDVLFCPFKTSKVVKVERRATGASNHRLNAQRPTGDPQKNLMNEWTLRASQISFRALSPLYCQNKRRSNVFSKTIWHRPVDVTFAGVWSVKLSQPKYNLRHLIELLFLFLSQIKKLVREMVSVTKHVVK